MLYQLSSYTLLTSHLTLPLQDYLILLNSILDFLKKKKIYITNAPVSQWDPEACHWTIDLRSRTIPSPRERVGTIGVADKDRLDRHSRVKCSWLEGDEAGAIGARSFWENHYLERGVSEWKEFYGWETCILKSKE